MREKTKGKEVIIEKRTNQLPFPSEVLYCTNANCSHVDGYKSHRETNKKIGGKALFFFFLKKHSLREKK